VRGAETLLLPVIVTISKVRAAVRPRRGHPLFVFCWVRLCVRWCFTGSRGHRQRPVLPRCGSGGACRMWSRRIRDTNAARQASTTAVPGWEFLDAYDFRLVAYGEDTGRSSVVGFRMSFSE